jgi:cyclopropane fatty-acyl-phospholipid synthase-like methyltransferase
VSPRTDFADLYDEQYYEGRGADPHVRYAATADEADTTQLYEWRGILRILEESGFVKSSTRWLDFGCGLGGLVRFARSRGYDVRGYDEGYAAERLHKLGVPSLHTGDLDALAASFDLITAIEVLEHIVEPLAVLERVASLLRPGGVLFVTTGNARPYRNRLDRWQYVRPDIHVSFFEPDTLRVAYEKTGLDPVDVPYQAGHVDLIRSKVLRTTNQHHPHLLERLVPWRLASRLVDRRFGVSDQPAARRP